MLPESVRASLPEAKGTYVVESYCTNATCVTVGKAGVISLTPGYYYYVGSAFGPGGLRSRLSRHLGKSKSQHWHFDYLKQVMVVRSIWYSTENKRLECYWAELLTKAHNIEVPKQGLGASDCTCISHFFYSHKALSFQGFQKMTPSNCDVVNRIFM